RLVALPTRRPGPPPPSPRRNRHRPRDRGPVCDLASSDARLRPLHEGRAHGLSQDPLRPSLLDLRVLGRRGYHPIRLDPVSAATGRESNRIRFDGRSLRAVSPASPFPLSVLAIVGLSLLGLPIGHAMIGGSAFYL